MTLDRILLELDRREHRGEGLPLYAPLPMWEEETPTPKVETTPKVEALPHDMAVDFTVEWERS